MKGNVKSVKTSVIHAQSVNVILNHIDLIILYIMKGTVMQVLNFVRNFTVDILSQRHC